MDAITNAQATVSPPVPELDRLGDEALRDVINRARALLANREERRKKEALDDIRRIAKAHGIDIAIRKPARRRGRPPKNKTED